MAEVRQGVGLSAAAVTAPAIPQVPDECGEPGRDPDGGSDRPPAVRKRSWLVRTVVSSRDFA